MRSWFIFTTTFTITTLVLAVTTWFISDMADFNSRYVLLVAIISGLLSLFMNVTYRLQRENMILTVTTDIIIIFTVVFSAAVIIGTLPISVGNVILTFLLVVLIYIIITLIYFFILAKEADDMNKKILEWRNKHVDS